MRGVSRESFRGDSSLEPLARKGLAADYTLSALRSQVCDLFDELNAAGFGVAKNGPSDFSGEGFRRMDARLPAGEMFHNERRHLRCGPGDR